MYTIEYNVAIENNTPPDIKEENKMSVKKMIELYVAYELSDDTWNMLREMSYHGLISRDNWNKFFDKCKSWTFTEDQQSIEDGNGKILYTRDEQGFMEKVA